jgi:hypothetical protein
MTRGRRKWETNPTVGTCELCGLGAGNGPMIRRRGRLYHRDCWEKEKGE